MYLLVDLEATCWEVPKTPDLNEIIDIGVVVCDENYEILGTWSSFVKPKFNYRLSPFCKRLTKIRQEEVDAAQGFDVVLPSFVAWFIENHKVSPSEIPWFTWGSWDLKCLNADCARNNLVFPFGEHRNLKDIYTEKRNVQRGDKCSVKEVLVKEGIIHNFRLHRGLNDALAAASIARVIARLPIEPDPQVP